MKKFGKLILIMCLMIFCFSGCGSTGDNQDNYTCGDLLDTICDEFGMYDYSQQEPYFASVQQDNPYFASVQKCVEWQIVSADDQDYDINAEVTLGELIERIVNAGRFLDETALTEDKVNFAIQNKFVEGSTDKLDRKIQRDEAEKAVTAAADHWRNPQYEEKLDYELHNNVVNLDEPVGNAYTAIIRNGNEVLLPADVAENITAGSVYLLRDEQGYLEPHRAASVDATEQGVRVVNNDEGLEFEDVFDELEYQNSLHINLAESRVTDGAGNVISTGNLPVDNTAFSAMPLYGTAMPCTVDNYYVQQTGIFNSGSFSFKIDDVTIKGKISDNSISFSADGKLNETMSFNGSYEISDFDIDTDIDYKWDTLKKARLSVDYTTKESLGFKTSLKVNSVDRSNAYTNRTDYSQMLGDALKKVAYDNSVSGFNYDGNKAKGSSKSIGIARIETPLNVGIGRVVIDIKLEINLQGSVELVITTNTTSGIEYVKGSGIRAIKEKNVDEDLKLKASLEGLLYAGPVINFCSFNLIDVGVKVGVGCSATSTAHLADYTIAGELAIERASVQNELPGDFMEAVSTVQFGGTLKAETCTDISAYFILRLTAGTNSLMGKFATLEAEICGKDNAELGSLHIEDGHFVDECTRKYRTEEDEDKEDEEQELTDEEAAGSSDPDVLDLASYVLTINGKPEKLELLTAPADGQSITWQSEDTSIATVDSEGVVSPVSSGVTVITGRLTSNPEICVRCTVIVQEIGEENWEFLPSDMSI